MDEEHFEVAWRLYLQAVPSAKAWMSIARHAMLPGFLAGKAYGLSLRGCCEHEGQGDQEWLG